MDKVKITHIRAREILDSRGNPTVEADVEIEGGGKGRVAIPSGASTGSHEAVELRDEDPDRYLGKGEKKAVANIAGEIADAIMGKNFDQRKLDAFLRELDGTPNSQRLGADSLLPVSLAFAEAVANKSNIPLFRYIQTISDTKTTKAMPVPMMNLLNGGKHAGARADFQEFMIVPTGIGEYPEQLRAGSEIFHALQSILRNKGDSGLVGDEGGFSPRFNQNEDALALLVEATKKAGYKTGKQVFLAIDVAATEFYKEGKYELKLDKKSLFSEEMILMYERLLEQFPICSVEDGLSEDDWDGWKEMTKRLGGKTMLVGDDLFVTNNNRLEKGVENKAGNAILIKPNQIGTLTETIAVCKTAKAAEYKIIVSHRSGETEDAFISHLAVGISSDYVKFGSLSRSERLAKYNELLRIVEENV